MWFCIFSFIEASNLLSLCLLNIDASFWKFWGCAGFFKASYWRAWNFGGQLITEFESKNAYTFVLAKNIFVHTRFVYVIYVIACSLLV